MGEATIQEHLGEGKYSIKYLRAPGRVQGTINALEERRLKLKGKVDDLESKIQELEAELTDILSDYDDKVDSYSSLDPEDDAELMEGVRNQILRLHNKAISLRYKIDQDKLTRAQYEATIEDTNRRLSKLKDLETGEEMTVWCADFRTELPPKSSHPTIEINAESTYWINLAPKHASLINNKTVPVPVMGPAEAAYNFAIHPGWQKWRPTYRLGTLTRVDREINELDVTLDEAESRYQRLEINTKESLSGIPAKYLDCDAEAFEVDDRVVVEFQNQEWSQARVVGFSQEPRPCPFAMLRIVNNGKQVIWDIVKDGPADIGVEWPVDEANETANDFWAWLPAANVGRCIGAREVDRVDEDDPTIALEWITVREFDSDGNLIEEWDYGGRIQKDSKLYGGQVVRQHGGYDLTGNTSPFHYIREGSAKSDYEGEFRFTLYETHIHPYEIHELYQNSNDSYEYVSVERHFMRYSYGGDDYSSGTGVYKETWQATNIASSFPIPDMEDGHRLLVEYVSSAGTEFAGIIYYAVKGTTGWRGLFFQGSGYMDQSDNPDWIGMPELSGLNSFVNDNLIEEEDDLNDVEMQLKAPS